MEVGSPGNEFYQPPQIKHKPPSEAILRYARIFVPHIKVTDWELDDDEYENDEVNIDEEADGLVLRGTKKSIAISKIPDKSLATLAEAYPDLIPDQAWTAETIAGPRYVIQIGKMVFYSRPDGQIQAGRRIDDGGLNEIYPPTKRDEKAFKADLEKLLGPYRKIFNFDTWQGLEGEKFLNAIRLSPNL